MLNTNTQHPSNTRTTFTIVLSIIFGVSIIPYTSFGDLYFTLKEGGDPILYKQVTVKIRKVGLTRDTTKNSVLAAFNNEMDKFYFIGTGDECNKSVPLSDLYPKTTKNKMTVNADGTAEATIAIRGADFTIGKTYKMCYATMVVPGPDRFLSVPPSVVYEVSYTSTDTSNTPALFTIRSMFTGYSMLPSAVSAGQGPVKLTITVAGHVTAIRFKAISQQPYFIPCTTDKCSDKGEITSSCSSEDNKPDTVNAAVVSQLSTGTIHTTFTAPVISDKAYMICVPYCFAAQDKAAETAGDCKVLGSVKWALVDSTPITFLPAKEKKDSSKESPTGSNTVPLVPVVKKPTTPSATDMSSTIPAVLITSVVFLYLYNW